MDSFFNISAPVLITCPLRVASLLADEVAALGFPVHKQYPAGVETEATLADTLRLNLHLRIGTRVLFRLAAGRAATPDDMYRLVAKIEWEALIPSHGYFSVISSIDTHSIDNSMFANVKCKDAIADRIRSRFGHRPDSGSDTSRTVVFLYWHGSTCAVYIDTSGEPLSKRGWRTMPCFAPMRENLAAAVIRSMLWNSDSDVFINPMCGSGTLAIEAVLIAQNKPSVWMRPNFGFMHLRGYSIETWQALRTQAKSLFRHIDSRRFIASDIAPRAIECARKNAATAGVDTIIQTEICNFSDTHIPADHGVVVLNPEYGMRLGDFRTLEDTYKQIGDFFKRQCNGKIGYIFTGNLDLAKHIGLRPKRRIEFYNADIDCRLIEYELYQGSRKIRKTDTEAQMSAQDSCE